MDKPPKWFTIVCVVALLWNLAGLMAVAADASLTQAEIAALPEAQRALYAARPGWSVAASVVAVVCGTLGSAALLFRRGWATPLLAASLAGVIVQDVGIFLIAGRAAPLGPVPFALQGVVLAVAVGLLLLARKARARNWLRGTAA